jgi:hypothetical protein
MLRLQAWKYKFLVYKSVPVYDFVKKYVLDLVLVVWNMSFLDITRQSIYSMRICLWNDPRHDKTNIVRLPPAWIQTSLRIHAFWSGSMLFAISFSTCNRVCQRTAWILIRLRGSAGRSGSMLVANALRWFCHGAAQILLAKKNVN